MRDQSLRGHVQNLEQQGELIRVDKETDPHGNVAAIGWKTYDRFGKSTLYTNLKKFSGWQLVSQERVSLEGARGFGRGDVFDSDGRLVASFSQESMIRAKQPPG